LIVYLPAPAESACEEDNDANDVEIGNGVESIVIKINTFLGARMSEAQGEEAGKAATDGYD
jgi:hypothetical protein